MGGAADSLAGRSEIYQSTRDSSLKRSREPVYGVVLLDRHGGLLGACGAVDLPGEVTMPLGLNLRTHDLRSYLGEDRGFFRPRRFPLVSAAWVQVKGRPVRVGIYVESAADRR